MTHSPAYWVGVLFGGATVGALCGLLPLLVGNSRKQQSLALTGFISCIVAGLILGVILALPVAIIFTVVIALRQPKSPLQ